MIPASFAPMILKLILPKVMEHIAKTFKLSEIKDQVKLIKDLVSELEKSKSQIELLAGEFSKLEDRIKKMEILNQRAD